LNFLLVYLLNFLISSSLRRIAPSALAAASVTATCQVHVNEDTPQTITKEDKVPHGA
jgi:hypothetical protein